MTTPARIPKGDPPPNGAELEGIPNTPDMPVVTEAEAVQAAKETGMQLVDLTRVKGFKKIGAYLTKAGLVPVHRAKLFARAESLERAREKLMSMLPLQFVDDESEPEYADPVGVSTGKMVVAIANTLSVLARVENETAELDLKLEKIGREDAPKAAHTNQAPPPGASVVFVGTLEVNQPQPKTIEVKESQG